VKGSLRELRSWAVSFVSIRFLTMRFLIASAAVLTSVIFAEPLPLIPLPASVKRMEGTFEFSAATAIRFDRSVKGEMELFAADLQARTGSAPEAVAEEVGRFLLSEIQLDIDEALNLPAGSYTLDISPKTVVVKGKDAAGVFYGTRTILQLLPALGSTEWKDGTPEKLPALVIVDQPRFAWRGMMLDVGRHFFPAEDIKRLIDWMAFHKLNNFHCTSRTTKAGGSRSRITPS